MIHLIFNYFDLGKGPLKPLKHQLPYSIVMVNIQHQSDNTTIQFPALNLKILFSISGSYPAYMRLTSDQGLN